MLKYFFLLCGCVLISSCEEVIDLDVPSSEPRLVIEASLNWFEGTSGNSQEILLSLTAPYFDAAITPATGAEVKVFYSSGDVVLFEEIADTGRYHTDQFIPEIGANYILQIQYLGEIYEASEVMQSVSPIDFVMHEQTGGFSGDEIEIKAFYTDPVGLGNAYLFEFVEYNPDDLTIGVYEDQFIDGNQTFAYFADINIALGNQITINNYGLSKQAYDYLFLLSLQSSNPGGGPFSTQPATVRGNCINTTNPDNYPFGYFRLSQAHSVAYTIE